MGDPGIICVSFGVLDVKNCENHCFSGHEDYGFLDLLVHTLKLFLSVLLIYVLEQIYSIIIKSVQKMYTVLQNVNVITIHCSHSKLPGNSSTIKPVIVHCIVNKTTEPNN